MSWLRERRHNVVLQYLGQHKDAPLVQVKKTGIGSTVVQRIGFNVMGNHEKDNTKEVPNLDHR